MTRILLVDDDPRIRSIIREYAQAEEWTFEEAGNGQEALRIFETSQFSLIVLDVMMPVLDGWATLKQIRATSRIPVILLTARTEEYDKLLGFELGVDDYVGKPFSPRELIARIKALLKRAASEEPAAGRLVIGEMEIDTEARRVKVSDVPVALTPKEYELLAFFAGQPGKVFSRDQLLNQVWGYDYYGDARTVDTHIRSLRDKIGPCRRFITTVWGTGYRFDKGATQ